MMPLSEHDCIIIGGGPAGLAAAIALRKRGIQDVLVLERNDWLGGILNQCIHLGFGVQYFRDNLTGPEYARALVVAFRESGARVITGAMVLGIQPPRVVRVASRSEGYRELRAKAIIVATGCRERTRENLEIPGTRPAGVYTAGQAQDLVNLRGFRIGRKVFVQGSGDIGLIMARRLAIEGYDVGAVFERLPYLAGLIRNKVQCIDHFDIPLRLGTQVCEVVGRNRLEGVWVEDLDSGLHPIPGTRAFHDCDTLLFSVGLIPEVDILREAGILPRPDGGIEVNSSFESGDSGIFLAGNACHIHDLADNASREGEAVASRVALYLQDAAAYASSTTSVRPYARPEIDVSRTAGFFEEVERRGATVCILCPRGCVVSEWEASCRRGMEYYRDSRHGRRQHLTTSVAPASGGAGSRLSIRSLDPLDLGDIPSFKAALEGTCPIPPGPFTLRVGEKEQRFISCPPA
jgi:NADPH-dependent 2,4-dienoyl-CoA reductase/sulfur reductase-like enzyme